MIPSKTHDKVGGSTIAGIEARAGIERNEFYAIEGFCLLELLVLAQRMDKCWDDGNEMRDWQNRLNGMIDGIKQNGHNYLAT